MGIELDERKIYLDEIAPVEGGKFVYEYDFGDSWEHVVLVEKILEPDPGVAYPVCITGKPRLPARRCGRHLGLRRVC